ncbi:LOW QUALITY PROTEIN: hypothetical protein PHMEG_00034208 [Phytophthora megakarya]|uniref:Uncharacterized protein n=1 Tax=Phytophthora megakarya TaxID=4795 RepID=A0A225URJ7_9STRA|nr:LOW QUALITY PROTEIN: hypothetical protein PHMEG_00034208 [Phytophthora megakarya]
MVMRYTELESAHNSMNHGTLVEYGIHALLLRRAESERVHSLLRVLTDFEGVTKMLQRSTLTLSAVRRLFDQVIQRYPKMRPQLSVTATIVNSVALESGIIKLQRKEPLSPAERTACADFRRSDTIVPPPPPSDLSLVQQAFKKRKVAKRSRYADVAFVPPPLTSAKDSFPRLDWSTLNFESKWTRRQMLMFLMYNKDMWDYYTVETVRA